MLSIYNQATICGHEKPFDCGLKLQPHLKEVSSVLMNRFNLQKKKKFHQIEIKLEWQDATQSIYKMCRFCLPYCIAWRINNHAHANIIIIIVVVKCQQFSIICQWRTIHFIIYIFYLCIKIACLICLFTRLWPKAEIGMS